MKARQETLWLIVAALFAALVTYIMLPDLVTEPRHINVELGGDASKNYFTFLYHSLYGKGAWFTGMNYPYGEHIVYVDGQPAISMTLAALRDVLHLHAHDVVGILYTLVALGFFLAIIITYKTLRVFEVPYVAAIFFAGAIIVMSPQVQRIFGHYGLSYYCIIPMLFYWTIQYHKKLRLKYVVYILVLGLIMSFIHPYFGAVILIWSAFYSAGYFLFIKLSASKKIKHLLPFLFLVIFVFGSIKLVMKLTDPVKDRPVTPIGMLGNGTTGEDVLVSPMSPIWSRVSEFIPAFEMSEPDEGSTYLGLVAIVVLIVVTIKGIISKISKKDTANNLVSEEGFSRVWLFVSVASLLLAMGVPFVWGMDWLLDYVPAFKQFRSLGRFAWLFYYTITVFVVVVIASWFQQLRKRSQLRSSLLLGIIILVWSIESSGYINYTRTRLNGARSGYMAFFYEANWIDFLQKHKYKPSDFQAILLLPFHHVGTEKFATNTNMDWPMTLCMRASLQMKLPIVDVMMSRSSWSQALAQLRLTGGPLTDKPLLHVGNKPFLLVTYGNTPLDEGSEYILRLADLIDSFSYFKVYALHPDSVIASDKKIANGLLPYYDSLSIGDTCIGCDVPYAINHFDNANGQPLFGNAGMPVLKEKEGYVAECIYVEPLKEERDYEFSAWVKVRTDVPLMPYFVLDVFNDRGDTLVRHRVDITPLDSKDMWFRGGKLLKLPIGTALVKCLVVNTPAPAYEVLDEVMLKPADAIVISKSKNGRAMVNNHIFK